MQGRWLAIALALSLLPEFLLGQTNPGTAASQTAGISRSPHFKSERSGGD